jgi:hypothetical protein
MAEALADRGDADELSKVELLAHRREQLEREVQQSGLIARGSSHARRVCQIWQGDYFWPHYKVPPLGESSSAFAQRTLE